MTHLSPYIIPGLVPLVITPMDVIKTVCEHHNIKSQELFSKYRGRAVVIARMHAMWLMRTRLKLKVKVIGSFFQLHYSSVIHAVKTIDDLQTTYPEHKETIDRLARSLNRKGPAGRELVNQLVRGLGRREAV